MGDQIPPPVIAGDRSSAVDVHQLRAGHWSGSQQYMHRIGRNPTEECHQCSNTLCTPGWCIVCHEEGDTPSHVLLRCPALMRQRFLRHGTIIPSPPEEVRDDGEVAALAAEMRSFQSRSATPRWRPAPRSAAGGTKQQQQQLFVWPQGLWLVPLPQWDARAAACDGSEPELWWMCTNGEPVSGPSRPSACAISDELQQACQQYSSPRCRTG